MDWLKSADVIVAEVSTPSLGVGYEIASSFNWGKKILCLYRNQEGKKLSAMISGGPGVTIFKYDKLEEAIAEIDKFFA